MITVCNPEDFYTPEAQLVFKELTEAFTNKKTLGRIVIETKLKQSKLPTNWIYEKTNINTSEELKSIASEIVEYAQKRSIYDLSTKVQSDITKGEFNLTEIANDLMNGFARISKFNSPTNINDILVRLKEEMLSIQTGKKLRSGFETMDLLLPPFVGGHSWIIGAFTGTGKTWFALQLIKNIVEQEGNVALFSTEMQSFENLGRIIGNQFDKGYESMWQTPQGTALFDLPEVKKYSEKIHPFLRIYDNKRTIQEISLECRSLVFQNKLDVIVIDFIQNIDIGNKDTYEGMRKIAQEIQRLAKELRIAIILTSQLSNSYARGGAKMSTVEYKNAGEIAAAADVGIVLFDQTDKYTDEMPRDEWKLPLGWKPMLCDIKKSRHTQPGRIPFLIQFPAGRIIEAPAKFDWINKTRRDDWWKAYAEEFLEGDTTEEVPEPQEQQLDLENTEVDNTELVEKNLL